MKIRKHKNNRLFEIVWYQRTPVKIETHVTRDDGGTQKVVTGGEFEPFQAVTAAFGSDSHSIRNAFLFGRDRTNIIAYIREV